MKLIVAFEGLLNCTLLVTGWPGARPATAGTVRYGVPERLLVAFTSVTPAVIPVKRIWGSAKQRPHSILVDLEHHL